MKIKKTNLPSHVAIIMDGNGRWALKRKLTRLMGHREGVKAVERIIRAANEIGIKVLTFFAFSTENWKRNKEEVDGIFKIMEEYAQKDCSELIENNIKVSVMGEISALPNSLATKIKSLIDRTANNNGLVLNIGINYGSRDEILRACKLLSESNDEITNENFEKYLYSSSLPNPDLIIRTSGEQRLSNFMLFQSAYSELYFTRTYWPSFKKRHLEKAIRNYLKRERRFGGLS